MEAQYLSEERWQQIQTILDEVFELPNKDRMAYLQRACRGDPDLHCEVESLLIAEADAPTFLERPALELAESLLSSGTSCQRAQIPDYTDRRIGPYRLLNELGRGGMGVVYRAERTKGAFDHEVAIKLLWNWQDREIRLDRFQREQQLLASLNHSNIAQLYDGGLTEEGQPYIVMEYVQGEHINHYCDHHQLTIDARLRLTLQVIDALHYAHRNLVIHRDIKPSNILVTENGKIKLLDFGIAKLLDDQAELEGSSTLDLTYTGEQLMTPGFAAPEQLRGRNVTVETDIFQLGLVLYELLTGHQAFREQADSFYEYARNICEREPTRPSLVANQRVDNVDSVPRPNNLHPAAKNHGFARGSRPPQWYKKLRGDLDAIVLKALRNEPELRYASMEVLGADIEAYFNARPVAARDKSARYRINKFVQRNTWAVVAGLSISALLVAYATTVTFQANRIKNALDQSRVEAHKAQQVSDFIIDIFKVSDPNVSGIETVTARELLDKSRERIDDRLSNAPEIKAQMLFVLGEIYNSLGYYEKSAELLELALQLRRRVLPKLDLTLASTRLKLAYAYMATGKFDEADKLLEDALAMHHAIGVESAEQAEILNTLGVVREWQANHTQAAAFHQEAIAILKRVTNGHSSELAAAVHNLAICQFAYGDVAQVEVDLRESLEMQRVVLGENHSEYANSINNLGVLLTHLERYDEAEPHHLRALKLQERILGKEHPHFAGTLGNLGILAHRRRQLGLAEDYFRRALTIQKKVDGDASPSDSYLLRQLGTVLTERGEYKEAESVFAAVLEIDRALLDGDSPRIGLDLSKRAALSHAKGDLARARTDYEQALERLPPESIWNTTAQEGYARVLMQLGEFESSEQYARAALETQESILPPGHSLIAEAQSTLGAVLAKIGRVEEAMSLLTPAAEILRRDRGADDVYVRQVRDALREIKQRPNLSKV